MQENIDLVDLRKKRELQRKEKEEKLKKRKVTHGDQDEKTEAMVISGPTKIREDLSGSDDYGRHKKDFNYDRNSSRHSGKLVF
jgi:hypothetical protein